MDGVLLKTLFLKRATKIFLLGHDIVNISTQECTAVGTEIKSQHFKVMCIDLSLTCFFVIMLKLPNIKTVYKKVEKIQVVPFRRNICDNFQNIIFLMP